jgi:gliding motility associated protien GldN
MRNYLFFLLVVIFAINLDVNAQILDPDKGPRAWKKDNVEQKEAVTLTYVREADVFWSKRVWRTIDLRQKMNLPLYYPTQDSATHGKRSLMQVIYDEFIYGAKSGPDAVKIYSNYELRQQDELDAAEVMKTLAPSDSLYGLDSTGMNVVKKAYERIFEAQNVTKFLIMEDWFFDKQRSVMDVRILAFGFKYPVYKAEVQIDPITQQALFDGWKKMPVEEDYWFFFPQMRPVFASIEVYNRYNDAQRLSYDDIFLKRQFGSYITKEENVYDRSIQEYKKGLDALIEADKIKNEIFNLEQELWEY